MTCSMLGIGWAGMQLCTHTTGQVQVPKLYLGKTPQLVHQGSSRPHIQFNEQWEPVFYVITLWLISCLSSHWLHKSTADILLQM